MASAWKCFDNDKNGDIEKYNEALLNDCRVLLSKHIVFHFGDEILMERHAKVEGNELVIGTQRYKTIVVPENLGFMENTQKLLEEFKANGGIITTADNVEANNICSSPEITYTEREYDGYKVYFFINNNDKEVSASFVSGGKVIDITSGDVLPFSGEYTFAPYDSLMLLDDGTPFSDDEKHQDSKVLSLEGDWKIKKRSDNVLTLDTCDVYFDKVLEGKGENVADVLYMALEKKKSMNVRLEYRFASAVVPDEIYLVCETPDKFKIKVNGVEIEKKDCGFFRDRSFRKIPIKDFVKIGENVISTETHFAPEPTIYEDIEKGYVFETEKNKLTFETEFESVYIIGDFSVKTEDAFTPIEKMLSGITVASPLMNR